jgi:hypothetical protein
VAAIFLIALMVNAFNGADGKSAATVAATTSAHAVKEKSRATSHTSVASKVTAEEDACSRRPSASGDIYVRMVTPGEPPQAQELGGEWVWNHTTNKCLTSVQMTIATAPLTAGNCTQVGYAANNSGYDVNAAIAAPLTDVTAQAGPACEAAAPASTTPAVTAAPPPTTAPAATTPASCYPISDEGTCYEPGEYCRDDDRGTSGVAGDGESIVCEDNDGWRWEPA